MAADETQAAADAEPSVPQDIRSVQTIKHESMFLLCDRYGDIVDDSAAALGLYFRDTRFLSRWELRIDGQRPLYLHSAADRNYSMLIETTLPREEVDAQGRRKTQNLQVSRQRRLGAGMHETIKLLNHGGVERDITLEILFGADFLDVFEVRGVIREVRGKTREPDIVGAEAILAYDGRDGVVRTTRVTFDPPPSALDGARAQWRLSVPPKSHVTLHVAALPSAGEIAPPDLELDAMEREYQAWRKKCTRFRLSNTQLQRYMDRAALDLRMMQTMSEDGLPAIDAGVPWFSTLFGRDSLITAYQALLLNPELAKGTLAKLAQLQGERVDEWRDEEPGKILHEIRVGELAAVGDIPHTPYYGSIDSTPLWLVVLGYVWNWTGDREFAEAMWPHAVRALEWIERYGDADGDGYVEYKRKSGGGLDNQGWKDSFDGILHEDGSIAEAPIALAEVQGYVYDAKRRIGELAHALGHEDIGKQLEHEAADLKERYNRDFWMNEHNTYAVGLDANKEQIKSVTSNPGHGLWSRIVDNAKAQRLARRLMAPDMLSGWGVRTLSSMNPGYDPIGYHTGTIWPHDNSLIAHGLMRYGFIEESNRVINELALAGAFFDFRYPELFCGYARDDVPVPVEYPVACRPQAWATGAPLLMMRSYAGMSVDVPNKTLSIVRPALPAWLERAEVIGMKVGSARVDLVFVQSGGATGVQVMRKDGDLDVIVRY
ncbi:MAG TPA: glycogen debranching N-terminal domain-containing protein [Actinomycetota bacterium]|nr:glycogen debranching N-terminal domain-containing protein [Actinomycetota bacterium]